MNDMINRMREKGYAPIFWLLGAVVAILSFLAVIRLFEKPVKSVCQYILSEDKETMASRGERIVAAEVAVAKMGAMSKRITTVGRLKANESIVFKCEMPGGQGRIKKIHFEQGTAVKKGDLLLEFEDSDLKARLSRAKAELEVKELEFARIEQLHKQKIESQKKFDEAKGALSMAKAQLEEAEANLKKSVLIAPFEGTAGIIEFSEGSTVENNKDLFKLVDETPMKIELKVPERYVHDVGVGQAIEVKVDAFKDRLFKGVVEAVDSAIDTDTHSLSLRGSIPNEDGQLKQGLFANMHIITGEKSDVLKIPETAIQLKNEQEIVYVVEKGKAISQGVLTGYRENGEIEVRAGLREGQLVVTAGNVQQGVKVKINNMNDEITKLLSLDAPNIEADTEKSKELTMTKKEDAPSKAEPAKESAKKVEPAKEAVKDAPKAEPAKEAEAKKVEPAKEAAKEVSKEQKS